MTRLESKDTTAEDLNKGRYTLVTSDYYTTIRSHETLRLVTSSRHLLFRVQMCTNVASCKKGDELEDNIRGPLQGSCAKPDQIKSKSNPLRL